MREREIEVSRMCILENIEQNVRRSHGPMYLIHKKANDKQNVLRGKATR